MTLRIFLLAAATLAAQPPGGPGAPGGPGRPGGPPATGPGTAAAKPRVRPSAFPERAPADPSVVARGKAVYGVHCTFCHGADARGGSGGPNLIRNEVVLNDQNGELIGKVLREGREGMPKFDLPGTQTEDIATFIHSFKVSGYDASRNAPLTIVTGDAKAGQAYFGKTCAGCHSVTGDLKGLASRFRDPKQLQQWWLLPGARGGFGPPAPAAGRVSPTTVTVTLAGGQKVEGTLGRIDDFLVTLTTKEGARRTYTRNGDTPKVEIKDPLQPHKDLLGQYEDKNIHDLTAYLVTIQ